MFSGPLGYQVLKRLFEGKSLEGWGGAVLFLNRRNEGHSCSFITEVNRLASKV